MALADIVARVRAAEAAAGRAACSVRLIAVSKVQPGARVEAVLAEGQRVFGENYVQEAALKWPAWRTRYPGVELHMIGPLQTNKAKEAVALFDVIETLDRDKLATALAAAMKKTGRTPRVLVQINTGAEPQKAGVHPRDADALIAAARALALGVEGLMCIPPAEGAAGPHFALLARIARRNDLPVLSMGMSGDFETAIRFGATHVRIGSALFGERNPPLTPSSSTPAP